MGDFCYLINQSLVIAIVYKRKKKSIESKTSGKFFSSKKIFKTPGKKCLHFYFIVIRDRASDLGLLRLTEHHVLDLFEV